MDTTVLALILPSPRQIAWRECLRHNSICALLLLFPSCLSRFHGTLASLFRCHCLQTSLTAHFSALAAHGGHNARDFRLSRPGYLLWPLSGQRASFFRGALHHLKSGLVYIGRSSANTLWHTSSMPRSQPRSKSKVAHYRKKALLGLSFWA
jgi:hypothetical protein